MTQPHSDTPAPTDYCSLSVYVADQSDDGTVTVKAECSCGEWEELISDVPINAVEDQARSAWMTEHLHADAPPTSKNTSEETDA